jgi:hypothetical protein
MYELLYEFEEPRSVLQAVPTEPLDNEFHRLRGAVECDSILQSAAEFADASPDNVYQKPPDDQRP